MFIPLRLIQGDPLRACCGAAPKGRRVASRCSATARLSAPSKSSARSPRCSPCPELTAARANLIRAQRAAKCRFYFILPLLVFCAALFANLETHSFGGSGVRVERPSGLRRSQGRRPCRPSFSSPTHQARRDSVASRRGYWRTGCKRGNHRATRSQQETSTIPNAGLKYPARVSRQEDGREATRGRLLARVQWRGEGEVK